MVLVGVGGVGGGLRTHISLVRRWEGGGRRTLAGEGYDTAVGVWWWEVRVEGDLRGEVV